MRATKRIAMLPVGRAARLACEIQALRAECCRAARQITIKLPLHEAELEDCARLDDALNEAQRLLKTTVKSVILSRLRRRSSAH